MDAGTAGSLLELAEAASAGATGPDAKASLERLEERLDDLLAAIAWFVDAGARTRRFAWRTRCIGSGSRSSGSRRAPSGSIDVLAAPGGDDAPSREGVLRTPGSCRSGSVTTSARPCCSGRVRDRRAWAISPMISQALRRGWRAVAPCAPM